MQSRECESFITDETFKSVVSSLESRVMTFYKILTR